ncbi:MAG: hypothetical protein ACR2O0_04825, partial [Rhizobiaceae bacterium]
QYQDILKEVESYPHGKGFADDYNPFPELAAGLSFNQLMPEDQATLVELMLKLGPEKATEWRELIRRFRDRTRARPSAEWVIENMPGDKKIELRKRTLLDTSNMKVTKG